MTHLHQKASAPLDEHYKQGEKAGLPAHLDDHLPADLADPEAGATTAEYGIVMLAAVGFAGLLVMILKSEEVRQMLLGIVQAALSTGS
ncbi:DUF4244 domain-containing protein [Rothia nasimurium]|uniref:DUF4244 domain-containing protein n=1 Tax=Rothia nasimurium TaxID=85336 RepID=UPI001F45329B|nr:DUF4244 domain-containing protein [Rothia nasimurium]